MRSPKGNVASLGAALVPEPQCAGHQFCRFIRLQRISRLDRLDGVRRIHAPPLGHLAVTRFHFVVRFLVIAGRRLAPDPRRVSEQLLDQIQHVIDTRIVNAAFGARVQAEIAAESEDVPGIDQGTTVNRSLE